MIETAAEYTHKALLRISLAEIQDQDLLEFNLRRYLRYATTWQAIVLIDEADVFLEARQSGLNQQSKENGLVAGIQTFSNLHSLFTDPRMR